LQLEPYRRAFIKGDTSLLKKIYIDWHDDIVKVVASKNLCAAEEIEDIFNEALIQFFESVAEGKITEVKSLKNYLIGICINLVLREKQSKLRLIEKIEHIRLHLYNSYDYKRERPDNKNLIRSIRNKMSLLSDRCQEIIQAYYLDRLTMKEIADYLNLSSSDVAKTLKSRCFKKLVQLFQSKTQ